MSTSRRDQHDAGGGARHRLLGHRVRAWCWPTPAPTSSLWGRRAGGGRRRSPTPTRTPTTCPGIALPEPIAATARPGRGARAAPRSSCSRCRRRRLRAQPRATGRRPAARRGAGQPDEGHRARHHPADERGHRRGRPGAGPERIAVVSGPNLAKEIAARQPAASVVACADEAVAEKLQQVCLDGVLPALHEHRRASASSSAAR